MYNKYMYRQIQSCVALLVATLEMAFDIKVTHTYLQDGQLHLDLWWLHF